MYSGGRGDGDRRTGSYSQDSSHGNQQPGFVPAYADTTSRRRIMNIEDILNPSDENTRGHQQPRSSRSYDAGRTAYRSHGSIQGHRAPRSGPLSHGANASARSRGDSGPPPHTRGSGLPDVPPRTRAFRPSYTDEEEHFIWYLRIDCGYSWHDIANAYNARFSQDGGEGRRQIPGLQCKFYRITDANGLPNVREMRRTRGTVQRCGMRATTGYTRDKYSWLDGRYPASTAYGHML